VEEGTLLERSLFGHRFVCDVSREGPQKLLYLLGERCVSESHLVRSLLRPGMNIVDVGANIGYYLLMFEQAVGPAGRVIAIEPSPENLPELRLNVDLNKLSNVEIIPKAVGDTSKRVWLRKGINSGVKPDGVASYSVEQELIDNLVTGQVDFLKIDIEGYEGFALKGARRVLSVYRPTIFLEMHPRELMQYDCSPKSIMNCLSSIYENISIYESVDLLRFYKKFLHHYAGSNAIQEVLDREAYVTRCERGEVRNPFWIVCRK
jgi:FkbM family methyltransferase